MYFFARKGVSVSDLSCVLCLPTIICTFFPISFPGRESSVCLDDVIFFYIAFQTKCCSLIYFDFRRGNAEVFSQKSCVFCIAFWVCKVFNISSLGKSKIPPEQVLRLIEIFAGSGSLEKSSC